MYKVIIYGIGNIHVRRKIENFLNDDFQIIGYMDTFLSKDIMDNKRYISMNELSILNFDYIIVAVNSIANYETIRQNLVEEGKIREDKIIWPNILLDDKFLQKDLVGEINSRFGEDIDTLIFGMSYSLRGIDKEILKCNCFDFSWHGLDLYYNYKLLKYAIEISKGRRMKRTISVFPYYYFNHDMSAECYQYETGQIISVSQLYDFHNRKSVEHKCKNYCINEKMFAKKYLEYYRPHENIYQYREIMGSTYETIGSIWKKLYVDTLQENVEIFNEFQNLILQIANENIILIPPAFIEGISKKDKESIWQMKQIFYSILGDNQNIKILDWFDRPIYQKRELFSDAFHLNYEGAKVFTNEINKIILEK